MGFRFRKSIKLGGARINLSKSGVGFSVGVPGARLTKKANGGTRSTLSIPGTGLSYVSENSGRKRKATYTDTSRYQANDYSRSPDCNDDIFDSTVEVANCDEPTGNGENRKIFSSIFTGIGVACLFKFPTLGIICVVVALILYISGKKAESDNYVPANGLPDPVWWLLVSWWWWIVEFALWVFIKPVYLTYRYIKYMFTQHGTDKFDKEEVLQSPVISVFTTKSLYKNRFYTHSWFYYALCIIFPTIALLAYISKKELRSKKHLAIMALCVVWCLLLSVIDCGSNIQKENATNENGIVSSSDEVFTLSDSDTILSSSDAIVRQTTTEATATTTTSTTTTTTTQPTTTTTTEYVEMVWIPQSGSRYHCRESCSNMENPREVTREEAERRGYTPCGRCY